MIRLWLPTLFGLLALAPQPSLPRPAKAQEPGFRLELLTTSLSGTIAIEVRIRNEGAKPALVNRRFAYAGLGNPVAELTFEGQPPPPVGCRFNVRHAAPTDYVLLGPGEFVGRTFDVMLAECFVGNAPTVKLRAHYRDQSQRGRKGPMLTTELVSNEIAIPRAAIDKARVQ